MGLIMGSKLKKYKAKSDDEKFCKRSKILLSLNVKEKVDDVDNGEKLEHETQDNLFEARWNGGINSQNW